MRKFIKKAFVISLCLFALAIITGGIFCFAVYTNASKIEIDEDALSASSINLEVFDNENTPIKDSNEISHPYASFSLIPEHTKEAFISIEDKSFYSHKGVNYKRIAKAMLTNIKAGSLKEGASTITQQLVKNTQLSSEKTFERKIKEIALAKKIEKKFNKEKILELYLNAIYFGNNCYGIESASNYYFSKPVSQLSLEESCVLAGIIKSPSKYSPIKNYSNALERRNLILSQMYKDEKISVQEYNKAKNTPINLHINSERKNKLNSYSQASIDEAEELLGLPAKQMAINGYKIYTYQNKEKQESLEKSFESVHIDSDFAGIVIDNRSSGISAYIGSSIYKVLDHKRQPGSCIKPVLVYAPALNEDIIYPCTQILDEKLSISQYTPKNVGNVYRGYISARDALSKSINIPAVKVLSYVGIDKAKSYAQDMGINFTTNDDSYSLALGGMTYGVNIKQLAGAYTTFANEGQFSQPKFVHYITDANNKIIYMHSPSFSKVLREDSTFLLTDMLKTCAKEGTAKKLSSLPCEIASKTGTVGKQNSSQNLDAWNISYTRAQTCGVWLGNLDNEEISYAGGNQPTEVVKNYFSSMEDSSHFEQPSSIIEKTIDRLELQENHRVSLANKYTPDRYTQVEMFSTFNLPNDISKNFTEIENPPIKTTVENGKVYLEFESKDYLTYRFIQNGKYVKEIAGNNKTQRLQFTLSSSKESIEVETFYSLFPDIKTSQKLNLIKSSSADINKKWYI